MTTTKKVVPGHWRLLGHDIIRHGYHTRPRHWAVVFQGAELAKVATRAEGIRWIRKHRRPS